MMPMLSVSEIFLHSNYPYFLGFTNGVMQIQRINDVCVYIYIYMYSILHASSEFINVI